MATTAVDIERIVREVLSALGNPPAAPALAAAPAPVATEPAAAEGQLLLDVRVVTMAEIAGRLGAARQVVVPPRALVTPAVRDELRRRGVALVRAAVVKGNCNKSPRLALVAARSRHDPAVLVRLLVQVGLEVDTSTSDCLIESTDRLAAEIARASTLGLLWTRHTAIGLCLANRHRGVRAVLASDVPGTAAAVDALGANVLVLDPAVNSPFQQKLIVAEFCRGGVRPCPESLKAKLE